MSDIHYCLEISYKGTHYSGWQIQSQGEKTIQGTLEQALKKILKQPIRTIASGRTDAGVHAFKQVVAFTGPIEVPAEGLYKALNSLLPLDIRVKKVWQVEADFHPIFSAKSKTYQYLFTEKEISPFAAEFLTNYSYHIDVEKIRQACDLLVGKHDFQNYFCLGTEVKSTVREIYDCRLERIPESIIMPEHWRFAVRGNGFLKQMVRLLVGSLWAVGREKVSLQQFKSSLETPLERHLASVAPAQGLYLVDVEY